MIYLHKILPYFFLPFTLAILLMVAGWLLRKKAVIIAGLCVLYFFSIPITARYLFVFMEQGKERIAAAEAPSAEAIVVLSGAGASEKGKSKVIEWQDPDRFLGGVQLFFAGKAPVLVFTGGWLPWDAEARPEGEVLAEQACLMGVPANAIMTTGKVSNTEQEAGAVAQMIRDRRKEAGNVSGETKARILLVTSAYHMPRAQLLFERAGLEVVAFPVDFRTSPVASLSFFDLLPNSGALDASETAIREFYGRLYYRLKP